MPAKLATVEYDPNRSARIGLLHYRDGEKRYMLLPHGLKVGDVVVAGPDAEARVGNALPLANIPLGTTIHNIELVAGQGRPDRPLRRRRGAAPRQGGRLRHRPAPVGRDASRAAALHGDGRARSATSTTRTRASARPAAPATWACVRRSEASR